MEKNITNATAASVYFNNGAIGCWLDFAGPLKDDSSNEPMFACKHLVDACRSLSYHEIGWRENLQYLLDDTPDAVKEMIIAAINGGDNQEACDAMAEHLKHYHPDVYCTALGWGEITA